MKDNSLLKGALSTLILKLLADNGQMYGYEIIQKIKEASAEQMQITEGALYPALHKMEQNGLLKSELRPVSGRTRKYYALSPKGQKATQTKLDQLQEFLSSVQMIIQTKASLYDSRENMRN